MKDTIADYKDWSTWAKRNPEDAEKFKRLILLLRDLEAMRLNAEQSLFSIQGGPLTLDARTKILSAIDEVDREVFGDDNSIGGFVTGVILGLINADDELELRAFSEVMDSLCVPLLKHVIAVVE